MPSVGQPAVVGLCRRKTHNTIRGKHGCLFHSMFPPDVFCGSETCFPPSLVEAESGRPAAAVLPEGRERWCAGAKSTFRTVREYFPQSTRVFSAKYDSPHCLLSSAGRPESAAISAFLRHGLNLPFWSFPGRWSAVRCRCYLSLHSCSVPLSRPSRPA